MTAALLISIWILSSLIGINIWCHHQAQKSRQELFDALDKHFKEHEKAGESRLVRFTPARKEWKQ